MVTSRAVDLRCDRGGDHVGLRIKFFVDANVDSAACGNNAAFALILRNTGDVGANLNFIRVENRNEQPILELGADHFINTFGNNRFEAGETLEFVLTSQLGFVVIVGYGDDNGNSGEVQYFPELPR